MFVKGNSIRSSRQYSRLLSFRKWDSYYFQYLSYFLQKKKTSLLLIR